MAVVRTFSGLHFFDNEGMYQCSGGGQAFPVIVQVQCREPGVAGGELAVGQVAVEGVQDEVVGP